MEFVVYAKVGGHIYDYDVQASGALEALKRFVVAFRDQIDHEGMRPIDVRRKTTEERRQSLLKQYNNEEN